VPGYLISDVSSRTGFSPPTLRYYEQIGLIRKPRRTSSGYRIFTDEDVQVLSFVAGARRLGLPLDGIRPLAEAWSRDDCRSAREHLASLTEAKLAEVDRRIEDLTALRSKMEEALTELRGRPAPTRCGPECGCDIEIAHKAGSGTRESLVSRSSQPGRAG
jgi:MerR family copper efflux transcriptional regulator